MANFETQFTIMDSVLFVPMSIQTEAMVIKKEERYGTVVAIRITRAKIFYDILDDYTSTIFSDVDSCNVYDLLK